MRNEKLRFRHELKYLINDADAALIAQKLSIVTQLDPNAKNGKYHVRSLYFDDYWDNAYVKKVSGVSGRSKYRIRVYNLNSDNITLECKIKNGSYINKQGVTLTRDELNKIIDGDYLFLLKRPELLCRQFYYQCVSRVMRPRIYVDYERTPYVLDAGDVRVTFDRNVRTAAHGYDMFYDDIASQYILEPGKLVMEVKYTDFMPNIVKEVLPTDSAEMVAVSKYILCCDKINHLAAKKLY